MIIHTLAHLGGRISSMLAGLVIATLVMATLGSEAMAVFGLYLVIQNLTGILDGGMTAAVNREMAILDHAAVEQNRQTQKLFRGFELISVTVAMLIFVLVCAILPFYLELWQPSDMSAVIDDQAFIIVFALAIAMRFSISLYQNALFGRQAHVLANFNITLHALLRMAVLAVILLTLRLDLKAVFIALVILNTSELLLSIAMCRRVGIWQISTLPDWGAVRARAHFILPVSGYTVLAVVLGQLDRLVFSAQISMADFGAYALIAGYAAGLNALAYAAGNVFYPNVTQVVHNRDAVAVSALSHTTLQHLMFLCMPLAIVAALWGPAAVDWFLPNIANLKAMDYLWHVLFLTALVQILTIIPHKIFLASAKPIYLLILYGVAVIALPIALSLAIHAYGLVGAVWVLPVYILAMVGGHYFFLARLDRAYGVLAWRLLGRFVANLVLLILCGMALHALMESSNRIEFIVTAVIAGCLLYVPLIGFNPVLRQQTLRFWRMIRKPLER